MAGREGCRRLQSGMKATIRSPEASLGHKMRRQTTLGHDHEQSVSSKQCPTQRLKGKAQHNLYAASQLVSCIADYSRSTAVKCIYPAPEPPWDCALHSRRLDKAERPGHLAHNAGEHKTIIT